MTIENLILDGQVHTLFSENEKMSKLHCQRFVACGFSPVKIDYSDYLKSFISQINEVYFFPKNRYSIIFFTTLIVEFCNRLFRCSQTCYCAGMISVTSTSHYQSQ